MRKPIIPVASGEEKERGEEKELKWDSRVGKGQQNVDTFLILDQINVMTMQTFWTRDGKQIFGGLFCKSGDERYDLFDPGSRSSSPTFGFIAEKRRKCTSVARQKHECETVFRSILLNIHCKCYFYCHLKSSKFLLKERGEKQREILFFPFIFLYTSSVQPILIIHQSRERVIT